MEKLNDYLLQLLSSCSEELRLEPDKNPYLVRKDRTTEASPVPLHGPQISAMVFPLIPPSVRASLPNRNEIEFVHPHNLGDFTFSVKKSPGGFVVSVRPVVDALRRSGPAPVETSAPATVPDPPASALNELEIQIDYNAPPIAAVEFEPQPSVYAEQQETTPVPTYGDISYEIESSASAYEASSAEAVPTMSIPELVFDDPPLAADHAAGGEIPFEIVPVNDPSFQTIFTEAAPEPPLGRRDDLLSDEYVLPEMTNFTPEQEFAMPTLQQTQPQPAFSEPIGYTPPAAASAPVHSAPQYAPAPQYMPAPAASEAAFVPTASSPVARGRMDSLFHKMAEIGASDLHMSVSMPPMVRRDGRMQPLEQLDVALTPDSIRELLTSIMPARNQEEFARRSDTDFAYEIPGMARFRSNIFADRKGMGAVFRIIPSKILTAEQLGLSRAIMDLCALSKGLVVVTGPTGSGKSTTLCAMVDHINKNREDHIITIEDPIEFVHDNQKCLVNQREVHNHTDSFKDALRAALREDPDIVLVGEMRDLETISIAIETAETGHLVFGTLHTTTAPSTVDRIIDQFPADRQQQIRVMLSESLKGVIAQTLLPKKGGGRVAALEVLIVTPAISNLIREGKTFQIPSAMQTGKNMGMVMLNDALFEHVKAGTVEPLDAYIKAVDKTGFETMLTRAGFKL